MATDISLVVLSKYNFVSSAMGSDKQMAPRCGFFHTFKPQEVLIKKWDKKEEGASLQGNDADYFQNNIQVRGEGNIAL